MIITIIQNTAILSLYFLLLALSYKHEQ